MSGRTLQEVAAAVRWPEHETRLLLEDLERRGVAERLEGGTWALTTRFLAEYGAAFKVWADDQ